LGLAAFARRQQAQQAAVRFIEQVDRAVGPLADVADPRTDLVEQALGFRHAAGIALEANQSLAGERAGEEVAAPVRPLFAAHEAHAGRRDRGSPLPQRRLDAGRARAFADPGAAGVLASLGDSRPAIVAP